MSTENKYMLLLWNFCVSCPKLFGDCTAMSHLLANIAVHKE